MSFTQYCDKKELEDADVENKFLGEDFRVYDKIQFVDDAVYHEIDAKEMAEILKIRSHLSMVTYRMHEMSFLSVEHEARKLRLCFEEVMKALGFKPDPQDVREASL